MTATEAGFLMPSPFNGWDYHGHIISDECTTMAEGLHFNYS
jgi:hypothetical protein